MENHIDTVGIILHHKNLPVGWKFRILNRTTQDADVCAFVNVTHLTQVLFTDMECTYTKSGIKGRAGSGRTRRLLRGGFAGSVHVSENRADPPLQGTRLQELRLRQRFDPRGGGSHGGALFEELARLWTGPTAQPGAQAGRFLSMCAPLRIMRSRDSGGI
jgi:hypothetical protein